MLTDHPHIQVRFDFNRPVVPPFLPDGFHYSHLQRYPDIGDFHVEARQGDHALFADGQLDVVEVALVNGQRPGVLRQVYLFIDRLNRHRVGSRENELTGLAGQDLERAKLLISMADWFASTGKPNFLSDLR